jgi:hypothetical protein
MVDRRRHPQPQPLNVRVDDVPAARKLLRAITEQTGERHGDLLVRLLEAELASLSEMAVAS